MSDIEKKKVFSYLEKDLFFKLCQNYHGILSCKKTNAVSALRKKQAWQRIQNEFNSSPVVSQKATTKQLIKLWYNTKAKAKEAKTIENIRYVTGGGSLDDDMTTTHTKVIDMDTNILTNNIQVDTDSDENGSLMVLDDKNYNVWGSNIKTEIPDLINEYEDVSGTPNSGSQPEASSAQEKDAKVDLTVKNHQTKKSRFRAKYINKIDLLKIKILEEELKHKKEMHQEEIRMKIKEREMKEKLWELEIKIKEKQLQGN